MIEIWGSTLTRQPSSSSPICVFNCTFLPHRFLVVTVDHRTKFVRLWIALSLRCLSADMSLKMWPIHELASPIEGHRPTRNRGKGAHHIRNFSYDIVTFIFPNFRRNKMRSHSLSSTASRAQTLSGRYKIPTSGSIFGLKLFLERLGFLLRRCSGR